MGDGSRLEPGTRVAVTGATGFVGRHVVDALNAAGMTVVSIGRHPPQGAAEHVRADLLDPAMIGEAVARARATHLLHLAWYAEHGAYWTSDLNLRWLDATARLVQAFASTGGRKLVAAGTCAEYDWSEGWCREYDSGLAPTTLYGVAKDCTRRLVERLCIDASLDWAWGRIFLPYGPGEDPRRLVPSLVEVFARRREPFGVNGSAYRDFLDVRDASRAFVHLLGGDAQGLYNVSSGRPVAIGAMVRTIAKVCGADPDSVLALESARPGEPAMLIGDNARLAGLGWRARHSPEDIDPEWYEN